MATAVTRQGLQLLGLALCTWEAAGGTLRLGPSSSSGSSPGLPFRRALSLLGLSSGSTRQTPGASPGDVSAVDELQDTLNDIGAKKTVEVAGSVGDAMVENLEAGAAQAEEAITDPVGTLGSLANRIDQTLQQPLLPTQGPTALPPFPAPQELQSGVMVPTVTPLPAPFNGVYCRGGACQYRNPPPSLADLALIGTTMAPPELCRGLACPPLADDPVQVSFVQNCTHLFSKFGGKFPEPVAGVGPTIPEVKGKFVQVCSNALPLEAGACPDYADVVVAALAPKLQEPSVGTVAEVCLHLFTFLGEMKQAEINLKLTATAFGNMKDPGSDESKKSTAGAAFLSRAAVTPAPSAGPCTTRGLQWRRWWAQRHRGHRRAVTAGSRRVATSMLQRLWSGGVEGRATYDPNPSCNYGSASAVMPTLTHYEIAPGAPDGSAPPVEVRGDLFGFCRQQALEITQDFAQPAGVMVQMTRDWCGFQSLAPPPDDPLGVPRHPEWDFRICSDMGKLMALAMRTRLTSANGVSANDACKSLFLTSGALHRVDFLVKNAWTVGTRGPPAGGFSPPPEDDPEQRKLVEEAMKWANEVYRKLKEQRLAVAAVKKAKKAIASAQDED